MREDNRFKKDRNFGRTGDRNGGERPTLFKAVCDTCGKSCEVPFKPSGNKPVYCNNCFSGGKNSEGPGRKSFNHDFEEKQMYAAVCAECGKSCRVPFKPSGNKPIYCSDCFENKERKASKPDYDVLEKLDTITEKLDLIIRQLRK